MAIPYDGDNVVSGLPGVESVVHRDVVVDTPAIEEEIIVNLEADSDRAAAEKLQAHQVFVASSVKAPDVMVFTGAESPAGYLATRCVAFSVWIASLIYQAKVLTVLPCK